MADEVKNGSLQKYLAYAGAAIMLVSFLFTVLWKLFAITSAVELQVGINSGFERRIGVLEKDLSVAQGEVKSLIGDGRAISTKLIEGDRRVEALEQKLSALQLSAVKMSRDLNEIETQFCANDNVRNLTHANDMRILATVFEKVFAQPYPIANAFYPKVCNRTQN